MTKSWFSKVKEPLEKSQHLALLITRNSHDISNIWLRKEYKAFITSCYDENRRIIIPIIDENLNIRDIPLFIREFQSVKLNDSDKAFRVVELIKGFYIPSSNKDHGYMQMKVETDHVVDPKHSDTDSSGKVVQSLDEDKLKKIKRKVGSFMDPRDGQVYKTIQIDDQIWLAENLYFNSENSRIYKDYNELHHVYGRLYTWDDAIKSCPKGWRLPDYYDWDELITKMGGYEVAGEFLVHSNARLKKAPADGIDTNLGLSLLYGGIGLDDESFGYIGRQAYFWSINEYNTDEAWGHSFYRHHNEVKRTPYDKSYYLSCRCIMDKEKIK